jgi:hypothetical protein
MRIRYDSVPFVFVPLLVLAAVGACGDVESTAPDAGDVDGGDLADAAPDAGPALPIGDVLDCGTPASAGGLAGGTDLQRVDLDVAAFPMARCNDGTAATFFFRPATTAAGRTRWVVQLQGGGSCKSGVGCAKRWCSVDTNFGMTQMTATLAPMRGTIGDGILRQGGALGEPNPVGDWNHVFVRYCSSDEWSGTAGPVDVDTVHPVSGAPVRFRIEFNGAHIVDAVIATLRRNGASPPAYTIGGGSVDLPDLDDATLLLFAGASAGSGGVTHNADRLREQLLATNGDLVFWALHDSGTNIPMESVDFSTTTMCRDFALCDYQTFMTSTRAVLWGQRGDASCATWHAANDPAGAFRCEDNDHVALHHVTTPMMVRMGLSDELIAGNAVESMFTVPGRGLITVPLWAELVRARMMALPQASGTAEEPAAQPAPRFAPPCMKHETLSSDAAVFGVHVTAGGAPRTMFDILSAALLGTTPTSAIWSPGDPVDCD